MYLLRIYYGFVVIGILEPRLLLVSVDGASAQSLAGWRLFMTPDPRLGAVGNGRDNICSTDLPQDSPKARPKRAGASSIPSQGSASPRGVSQRV